jgi:hypothetical protein
MEAAERRKYPNADGGRLAAGAVIHASFTEFLGSDGAGRRRIGARDVLELDQSGRDKADAHDPGGR